MKTMKVALLATAALAAVSVSARADDAAAIKAQLEALNARIAQLEAGPALPVGYSLLALSEVDQFTLTGEKASDVSATSTANRISVLPTADAPAAASISWSAEIRAALTHRNNVQTTGVTGLTTTIITPDPDGTGPLPNPPDIVNTNGTTYNNDETVIKARGRIRAQATTSTSVGDVGIDIRLQGASEFGGGAAAVMNIAWGWWAMTPEWTLGGGYTGTLADPGHGMDSYIQFGTTIAYGTGDQEQFRLTYASGPLTWAVALEDNDSTTSETQLAVASRINYAGDAFSASLAGYYRPEQSPVNDYWQIAAGATMPLGDIATFSVNGAVADTFSSATAYVSFDLTDATFFEVGAGRKWNDGSSNDTTVINGGIYWKPVDQLKVGLQADHIMRQGVAANTTSVSLVTWFSY